MAAWEVIFFPSVFKVTIKIRWLKEDGNSCSIEHSVIKMLMKKTVNLSTDSSQDSFVLIKFG